MGWWRSQRLGAWPSRKKNIAADIVSGKFMLMVFGALAELEREGIAEAEKAGKYKGRKPAFDTPCKT